MKNLTEMTMEELMQTQDAVAAEIKRRQEAESAERGEIDYAVTVRGSDKTWAKRVEKIDPESQNGYGLIGEFLDDIPRTAKSGEFNGKVKEGAIVVISAEEKRRNATNVIVALRAKAGAEFKCYSGHQTIKGVGFEMIDYDKEYPSIFRHLEGQV